MRVAALLVMVAAGCFKPAPAAGVPCSPNLECPGDQKCDTTQDPPVCGGGSSTDSGVPPDNVVVACGAGCPADQPVCDSGTQTCRGCIADAECPSDVCHELVAKCVDETAALYASSNGGLGNCTRAQPCSLDTAISLASATRNVVKLADGTYSKVKIDKGVPVVLSGSDNDPAGAIIMSGIAGIQLQSGTAIVEGVTVQMADNDGVTNDGDLTLSHVAIEGSKNNGVRNREKLRMIASRVANGNGLGIAGQGATSTTIERSTIAKNPGGGIAIDGGIVSITNSMVVANGDVTSQFGGVAFTPLGQLQITFRFNTVASNRGGGPFSAISCAGPTTIDSNIIADNDNSPLCNSTFSLFTGNLPGGLGNLLGTPQFVLPGSDFHILANSPARDKANPNAGETVDIDGQARPQGGQRYIGADEVP